jgi:hypothetical protein
VEWLTPELIPTLSGRYDLIHSILVFQHIPSREGERIFSELLRGLLPGGIGAVQVTLRPSRATPTKLDVAATAPSAARSSRRFARGLDLAYPYMLLHSYSLNRLGGLMADAGVTDWHVRWSPRSGAYQPVIIFFRKAAAESQMDAATSEVNGRAPVPPPRAPEPPADANAA